MVSKLHGKEDTSYNPLLCESDSMCALSFITNGVHALHPLSPLICIKIQSIVERPWQVSFKHIFREDNECADWLAKHGASGNDSFTVWESCPQELNLVLLADATGTIRIRYLFLFPLLFSLCIKKKSLYCL